MLSTIAVAAGLVAVAVASRPETTTSTVTVDVTVTSCDETHTACPYAPTATDKPWEDWSSTTSTSTGCGPTTTVTTVTGTHSSKVFSYTKTITIDDCTTTIDDASSTTSSAYTWADWTSTSSISVDPVDPSTDYTWSDWSASTTTTASTDSATTTEEATGCGVAPTAPPAWISLLPADKASSISAKWSGTVGPADWCYWTYSASISTSATAVAPVKPTGTASSVVAPYGGSATGVKPASYTGAASANAGSLALAGLAAAAVMVIA